VRVLEALKILKAATLDCKTRDIDMPEVSEALDVLEPYCQPECRVSDFRHRLKRHDEFGSGGEGQQQVLRVYFGGIYDCVRDLLSAQIRMLNQRYRKTNDATIKAELDRLTAELSALPNTWRFVER